jgi:molybdopterin converting factor small subunit
MSMPQQQPPTTITDGINRINSLKTKLQEFVPNTNQLSILIRKTNETNNTLREKLQQLFSEINEADTNVSGLAISEIDGLNTLLTDNLTQISSMIPVTDTGTGSGTGSASQQVTVIPGPSQTGGYIWRSKSKSRSKSVSKTQSKTKSKNSTKKRKNKKSKGKNSRK